MQRALLTYLGHFTFRRGNLLTVDLKMVLNRFLLWTQTCIDRSVSRSIACDGMERMKDGKNVDYFSPWARELNDDREKVSNTLLFLCLLGPVFLMMIQYGLETMLSHSTCTSPSAVEFSSSSSPFSGTSSSSPSSLPSNVPLDACYPVRRAEVTTLRKWIIFLTLEQLFAMFCVIDIYDAVNDASASPP